ncbi:TPA: hypothetical protein VCL54_001493 [Streptococcus pyogenes]|nr:hypothetical protein [Streptococcus agalactiae]HEP3330094.1 hypothetical protein [Streptococcus pyogenes]HEP4556807.1 hypothetical protein [Streptococcus pyogenes]
MSNNIEIIMNLDNLEIFEVIDLDEEKEAAVTDTEELPEEVKTSPYDELGRIWLGNGYYYKPSSIIYQVIKDDVIHQLSPRNKHGTYPYYKQARDGTWGHVYQLTQEEALWLTLDLNPELMSYL